MIDHTDAAAPERDNHRKAADDGEVQEKVIRLGDEISPRALPERVIHDGYRNEREQGGEQEVARPAALSETDEETENPAPSCSADAVTKCNSVGRQAARGYHVALLVFNAGICQDAAIQKRQLQKDPRKQDQCA